MMKLVLLFEPLCDIQEIAYLNNEMINDMFVSFSQWCQLLMTDLASILLSPC